MIFELVTLIWLTALTLLFLYHMRRDCADRRAMIGRLERQDKRLIAVMDRIDQTLLKLIPS